MYLGIVSFTHPIADRITQSTADDYSAHRFACSVQDFGSVPINFYEAGKEFEFVVPLERANGTINLQ